MAEEKLVVPTELEVEPLSESDLETVSGGLADGSNVKDGCCTYTSNTKDGCCGTET